MNPSIKDTNDAKKLFRKCGTCSQTFGHLLNREFGNINDPEERALDPLAGGIMNKGHQCGMLWGAALAVGAESFRRNKDLETSIAGAVTATQHLMESFVERSETVSCREITGCNLNSVFGFVKFMLKTTAKGINNSTCFNLAEQWAPEAISSAREGLTEASMDPEHPLLSCASEVVKKMGASPEEMVKVAGFAGGLGLSGNACGALSAAIWMKTLSWCKANPGKNPPFLHNPAVKKVLKTFNKATDSEFLCSKISGQNFETIGDHSEFIKTGGCDRLIDMLANS